MNIDITLEAILEDLCWPGPPPGRWELPEDQRTTEQGWTEWEPIAS